MPTPTEIAAARSSTDAALSTERQKVDASISEQQTARNAAETRAANLTSENTALSAQLATAETTITVLKQRIAEMEKEPDPIPDPEPEPEPVPSSSILFDDRFVNAQRLAPQNGVSYIGTNVGNADGDAVFLENGALCFRFGGNPNLADYAFSEQNFRLPDLEAVFIGLDMECDADYHHRDSESSDNNKGLRLFGGMAAGATRDQAYQQSSVKAGCSYLPGVNGVSNLIAEFGSSEGSTSNYGTGPWATVLKAKTLVRMGFWAKVGTKLLSTKMPNSKGQIQWNSPQAGDGVFTIWRDKAPIFNRSDCPIVTPGAYNRFQYGYILGWSNSGFTKTTIIRLRRFVVATQPLPEYTG